MITNACAIACQAYTRVQYAGNTFRTRTSQAKQGLKHDDSHFRYDFRQLLGRGVSELKSVFGQIKRLLIHEAYPAGPRRVVVDAAWLEPVEKNEVSGNHLVTKNKDYFLNHSSRSRDKHVGVVCTRTAFGTPVLELDTRTFYFHMYHM